MTTLTTRCERCNRPVWTGWKAAVGDTSPHLCCLRDGDKLNWNLVDCRDAEIARLKEALDPSWAPKWDSNDPHMGKKMLAAVDARVADIMRRGAEKLAQVEAKECTCPPGYIGCCRYCEARKARGENVCSPPKGDTCDRCGGLVFEVQWGEWECPKCDVTPKPKENP